VDLIGKWQSIRIYGFFIFRWQETLSRRIYPPSYNLYKI
jgi:hypothetical protein